MESWEQELDQYLAPHGVVFSKEATQRNFKEEVRSRMATTSLPFLSAILLKDGIGSFLLRMGSLIILPGFFLLLFSANPIFPQSSERMYLLICSAIICLPGLWMWWYRLMPPEKRIERMLALLQRKTNPQQYPPP